MTLDYKRIFIKEMVSNFLDEFSNTGVEVSPELSRFLIPTLIQCLEKSLDTTFTNLESLFTTDKPTE